LEIIYPFNFLIDFVFLNLFKFSAFHFKTGHLNFSRSYTFSYEWETLYATFDDENCLARNWMNLFSKLKIWRSNWKICWNVKFGDFLNYFAEFYLIGRKFCQKIGYIFN